MKGKGLCSAAINSAHLPNIGLGLDAILAIPSRFVGTYVRFWELVRGATSMNFFILNRLFDLVPSAEALLSVLLFTYWLAMALARV